MPNPDGSLTPEELAELLAALPAAPTPAVPPQPTPLPVFDFPPVPGRHRPTVIDPRVGGAAPIQQPAPASLFPSPTGTQPFLDDVPTLSPLLPPPSFDFTRTAETTAAIAPGLFPQEGELTGVRADDLIEISPIAPSITRDIGKFLENPVVQAAMLAPQFRGAGKLIKTALSPTAAPSANAARSAIQGAAVEFPAVTQPASQAVQHQRALAIAHQKAVVERVARVKPREIPDGPRMVDPSGPTLSVTSRAGVTAVEPEDVLRQVQQTRLPGEAPDQALLRIHGGAIRQAEGEIRIVVEEGNARLKALGIGKIQRGRLVAREEDIQVFDDLFEALHNPSKVSSGEITVPANLQHDYKILRELTDLEEAMRIDFDPAMATVEDYFYRGWRPPEGFVGGPGVGGGRLGAKPGFVNPRVDATYREMREAGFEPLFWNPYEQLRVSKLMGVRFRQQIQLIDDFKGTGLAVPHSGGAVPKGWRVPKVGPAFEGKPFVATADDGTQSVMYTRRWLVPDQMADRLENMYGVVPELKLTIPGMGGRQVDVLKAVDIATFVPKRARLFGSLFQLRDFIQRSFIGSWTEVLDAIKAGRPVEAAKAAVTWPKSTYTILESNISSGARQRLRIGFNSTESIVEGRPNVHMQNIGKAGLSDIDVTIFGNIDEVGRVAVRDAGALKIPRGILRQVGELESAIRRGLFEGVYRAAILTDIKNNIAPMLARQFPNLSDEALNGMIARTANLRYSTIPAEQSVIQQKAARYFLTRVMFSFGEPEALLRQATQAVRGPNAAFWRKNWIASYLSMIGTANVIHFAATGEALPLDRYTLISRNDFGPLPFGYNRKFAAPTLPLTGRNSTEIMLDIMGQMDTVFKTLDPIGFATSRESVPIRAVANWFNATDFAGRPTDTVGPGGIISRTAQLIQDLFLPIGAGTGVAQLARKVIPGAEQVIGEIEGRIGPQGQVLEGLGFNVLGETTSHLRERATEKLFPGKTFNELTPPERVQVNESSIVKAELTTRRKVSLERDSRIEQYRVLTQGENDRFNTEINQLFARLVPGEGKKFRDEVSKQQIERSATKETLRGQFDEDLKFLEGDSPFTSKFDEAQNRYFVDLEAANLEDPDTGDFNFKKRDEVIQKLRGEFGSSLIDDIEAHIQSNDPEPLKELRNARETLKSYFEIERTVVRAAGLEDKYDEFQATLPEFKADFLKLNPGLVKARSEATLVKEAVLMFGDPETERLLLRWGYITTPTNPTVLQEQDPRRTEAVGEMLGVQ